LVQAIIAQNSPKYGETLPRQMQNACQSDNCADALTIYQV